MVKDASPETSRAISVLFLALKDAGIPVPITKQATLALAFVTLLDELGLSMTWDPTVEPEPDRMI